MSSFCVVKESVCSPIQHETEIIHSETFKGLTYNRTMKNKDYEHFRDQKGGDGEIKKSKHLFLYFQFFFHFLERKTFLHVSLCFIFW